MKAWSGGMGRGEVELPSGNSSVITPGKGMEQGSDFETTWANELSCSISVPTFSLVNFHTRALLWAP